MSIQLGINRWMVSGFKSCEVIINTKLNILVTRQIKCLSVIIILSLILWFRWRESNISKVFITFTSGETLNETPVNKSSIMSIIYINEDSDVLMRMDVFGDITSKDTFRYKLDWN